MCDVCVRVCDLSRVRFVVLVFLVFDGFGAIAPHFRDRIKQRIKKGAKGQIMCLKSARCGKVMEG